MPAVAGVHPHLGLIGELRHDVSLPDMRGGAGRYGPPLRLLIRATERAGLARRSAALACASRRLA